MLEVKGLKTSGGTSRPGGQGREKLESRYLPLMASSTSLPHQNQNHSAIQDGSFTRRCCHSHRCLALTSLEVMEEP